MTNHHFIPVLCRSQSSFLHVAMSFVKKPKHFKVFSLLVGSWFSSLTALSFLLCHPRSCDCSFYKMNLTKLYTVHELYILFRIQFYCACAMIKTKHQSHTTQTQKKGVHPGGPGPMFNDGPQDHHPPRPPPPPLSAALNFQTFQTYFHY